MSCYMQKTRWSLPCPWGNRYWRWEPPKSRWRRISHTRTCETQKPKHPQSLRARWRRPERTPAPPALQKPTEVQPPARVSKKCSGINGSPSPGESDDLSMHSWLKADRQGRSRTATASPKTSKSSTTSVKCSHWVQMCAGCSHTLLVCMRQVWPTTASSHQPPPAPAEPRPGALNKRKEPDETWTRDPGNDNRNPERLVAHWLWHTDCHDPLDLSHQHEEKSLMAWAAVPSKAVVLLLTFCLLLLPLWESVIALCFVVRYFMSILVL